MARGGRQSFQSPNVPDILICCEAWSSRRVSQVLIMVSIDSKALEIAHMRSIPNAEKGLSERQGSHRIEPS